MNKKWYVLVVLFVSMLLLAACAEDEGSDADASTDSGSSSEEASSASNGDKDTITIVYYPNESGAEMKNSRDAIGAAIEEATGVTVEHQFTTDYAIAIETIANGNADLAFMGAVGYIEANTKNDAVQPLVVPSGPSGTLDDAIYYSWLAVNIDEQDNFKVDGEFSLDTIADKPFSFVSNSSTSGFVVPSSGIIEHFSQQEEYADLTQEDLMEGGPLFSQVLFGGSHQGSAVNLLNNSVEVAAFCDTCVESYVELVEGEENTVGAVYRVRDDAAEPFNTVAGEEFILMSVTPVLNAPFAANLDELGQEYFDQLQELFASDEMANNEAIFVPSDSDETGLFYKGADERFIPVDDEWFNPIRELQ